MIKIFSLFRKQEKNESVFKVNTTNSTYKELLDILNNKNLTIHEGNRIVRILLEKIVKDLTKDQ